MKMKILFITLSCLLVAVSCKDPYLPRVISAEKSLLVVEGNLNAGGITTFRLTRTAKIDNTRNIEPEVSAQLTVEGRDNSIQPIPESGQGLYVSPSLQIALNGEYRVRIKTADGKEYLSEYVVARQTPAIDSIGFKLTPNGATIYVNTHDPSNNTRYYRWEYDETWEIHSSYFSKYIYDVDSIRLRRMPEEEVYQCWKYGGSTSINISTSTRLVEDKISEAPLLTIPYGDEKLSVRYSIMVRQYALDKKGYEFYELMKKNTESLGSIFDAQPTEIIGNITCVTDPEELVIGYINSSTVTERRKFITHDEVDWNYSPYCPRQVVPLDSIDHYFRGGGSIPYDAVFDLNTGLITAYLGSFASCVDCRLRHATLSKPSYW